jgi:hypothetical protein
MPSHILVKKHWPYKHFADTGCIDRYLKTKTFDVDMVTRIKLKHQLAI